ncbi:MAG: hypothetical protein CMI26_01725 [Opitutae bacterium]|nr:hypothetical protein [Opitutae bacterium]|tara:strand:- start:222 stop:791 length:570 start_codon:yes stop_codon:yes gene_type:complete
MNDERKFNLIAMTLEDFFATVYKGLLENKGLITTALVSIPVVGTLGTWIGKRGKTEKDGIFLANLVIWIATGVFAFAVIVALIGMSMEKSLLQGDFMLLCAPIACVTGTFFGIRKIFPLGELSSTHTLKDIGIFLIGCLVVWFIFKTFRGWGILFFGSVIQLVLWLTAGYWLMRRMAKRAFGKNKKSDG